MVSFIIFNRMVRLYAFIVAVASTSRLALGLPKNRIRGVNLGGWLVLERWIKPSLFQDGWEGNGWPFSEFNPLNVAADEWSFCELQGKEVCERRLMNHWDTWVTEKDLKTLANAGVNHVRIPVGYWIMGDIQDDEPYVTGKTPGEEGSSLFYLTRVCSWAKKYDQQVWIDLHGAPGSQNGFDNSGHYGNYTWDSKPENVERSVKVLEQLAEYFAKQGYGDVLAGIGLLNEPETMIDTETLTDFYADAFRATRKYLPDCNIFLADRFIPSDWNDLWATGGPDGYQDWDSTDSETNTEPFKRKLGGGMENAEGVDSMSNEALNHLPRQSELSIFHNSVNQLRGRLEQQQPQQDVSIIGHPQQGIDTDELERKLHAVDLGSVEHPGSFANSNGSVLLDTHIYHVFTPMFRLYPAVKHIGHVCLSDAVLLNNCCWQNNKPTKLKRMVGEWTTAFDQLPAQGLETREATMKPLTNARKEFLKRFARAQMITFEMEGHVDSEPRFQTIQGWFFWNFKMELEVYREWDYLKGLERGWIPKLPTDDKNTATAMDLFGSCEDQRQVILHDKRMKYIVDAYPDKSLYPELHEDPELSPTDDDMRVEWFGKDPPEQDNTGTILLWLVIAAATFGTFMFVLKRKHRRSEKGYGETSPLLAASPAPGLRGEISIKELDSMVERN